MLCSIAAARRSSPSPIERCPIKHAHNFINLTGQTFGRLLVIEPALKHPLSGNTRWLCECSCPGKTRTVIESGALRSGNTKSCGCLRRELLHSLRYRPTINRFCDLIEYSSDGCWLWTGFTDTAGYSRFSPGDGNRKTCHAHIFSYEHFIGPVPQGKELDHLCRIRRCVNPTHLEPVTHLVNMRRGSHATKTHCKQGHPLSGENLYLAPNGCRRCRTCKRIRQEKSRHAKRAAKYIASA